MSSSFYYLQAEKSGSNSEFLNKLEQFAVNNKVQTYVVSRPLGESKYTYDYDEALVVLVPNYKILFINFGDDAGEFEDFVEDFIEDTGSLADKFRYREVIGRPKKWAHLTERVQADQIDGDVGEFIKNYRIADDKDRRNCELIISLLTGSINDIEKVKGEIPNTLLDKIKQKILLFDGDQTKFVYQKPEKKRVSIQGLSGTGKTELLLHKLKEIYTDAPNTKIALTCHNKILADKLRRRIPLFFDFMKVEEQIKWNERLWCVHAWGSGGSEHSGVYRYICKHYNISFLRYSYSTDFDYVCKLALKEIKNLKFEDFGYAFDYILIDESQDFPQSFFDLCELVSSRAVYVAGDIFQSIFDDTVISEINPDFLLSKCYRTDPRTLMFAHALGMGLFEETPLRWLEDKEWAACGYIVDRDNNRYLLSREPLRRFEDLDNEDFNSVEIVSSDISSSENLVKKVIEIINKIKDENQTVEVSDIGIVFIDYAKDIYITADMLSLSIMSDIGWMVNKAYETKSTIKDSLFISNRNNVKGLEFPFVICITKKILPSRSYRNSLYMMLTRSFLKTYFLISEESEDGLLQTMQDGLKTINEQGHLNVRVPSKEEQEKIRTTITYTDESIPYYDYVETICAENGVDPLFRGTVVEHVMKLLGEERDRHKVERAVVNIHDVLLNK